MLSVGCDARQHTHAIPTPLYRRPLSPLPPPHPRPVPLSASLSGDDCSHSSAGLIKCRQAQKVSVLGVTQEGKGSTEFVWGKDLPKRPQSDK